MGETKRDILRLTHCTRCRYDLEGLPRKYVCPECEYAYDETMSLIRVWDELDEPKISTVATNTLLASFFSLLFLTGLWTVPGSAVWGGWSIFIVSGVGSFGYITSTIKAIKNYRLRDEGKAADALEFAPYGYAVSHEGRGRWETWKKVKRCKVRKMKRGRWRLHLRSSWWRFYWKVGKKFIFKATPRQAAAIRSRIRWCIAESRKVKA